MAVITVVVETGEVAVSGLTPANALDAARVLSVLVQHLIELSCRRIDDTPENGGGGNDCENREQAG